jgi:Phytanoyl-CoA dioxygenase (PhyH)
MPVNIIRTAYPDGLPEAEVAAIAETFFRDGCVVVPGVFTPEEVQMLRERTDSYYADRADIPQKYASYAMNAFVLRYCAELDPLFAGCLTAGPIPGLVAAVLGPHAKFNALNVIRNEPGTAISVWHVDDVLEFPLPEDIPRFDARMRMPVFWFTVQVALSDIDSVENGPTQYVPGSHYSGRKPPVQESPEFEGQGPVDVLCKAGDIYFTNHQTWHRGSPNVSNTTRYVMQLQFAQRWADARFRGIA